jgi:hypothetical protein
MTKVLRSGVSKEFVLKEARTVLISAKQQQDNERERNDENRAEPVSLGG